MIARILASRRFRLVVVAVVPALVLGVFIGALAAADSGSARIPAALVNEDRLVTAKNADGSTRTVAAGRLVVTGLTKPSGAASGASIDWTLTNASDARDLLDKGDVYAVVTIPRDFSKSISSLSGSDPQQADIRITTDDAHGTIVSQLGGTVGDTIARTVGGRITESVVSGLYGGYATLRTALTKAASGANDLGDGAAALSDGLDRTATGADSLASGEAGIATGARGLGSGASSLASGLRTAANGAASAASGAKRYAAGVDSYTDGVDRYTRGVDSLASGLQSGLSRSQQAQQRLASGSTQIAAGLRQLAADPTLSAAQKGGIATLAGKLDEVAAGQSQLAGGSSQLGGQLGQLTSAGARLRTGGGSLDSGATSLASGIGRLPAGIRSAAGGADRLANGAAQLGSGADRIAAGSRSLATGIRRSAGGADSLASGARKLGTGLADGAKQVPSLTSAQQTQAAKVVAEPITASADRRNALSGPGEIVSTLIIPVGLWIGAAALVLLFGAVARRLLRSGVGTGRLVGSAFLRGAAVAAVQAVLVCALLAAAVHPAWSVLVPLALVAFVAGVAFLAIHQLLQSLFGRAGTVLSIVLLGVQLVAAGGLYPIQLVSAPFQAISPLLPLTAAVDAVTAVLTGAGGVLPGVVGLVIWAVLAFVAELALVGRRRTSPAAFAAFPAPA